MKYTFSENTVAEFYGRQFHSITNELGELCAYSERVFEIKKEVVLHPGKTLIFEKAIIIKGVMHGGVMRGGVMWGGEMHGGEMHGGEMHGGVMCGGEMHGGVMHGGEMHGGVMWGGVMRGGVMCGGEMHGGVMHGGEIKVSMLQIQGTRHFCYASPTVTGESIWLGIGCEFHSIEWWLENFESVGKSKGYTTEQIAEYKLYIDLFALRYPSQNEK
jgi:hypothetical protein